MLVSRIAQRVLQNENPTALDLALAELSTLAETHPDLIENERDHPFTECATFADDIKGTFGGFQSSWHFIDQPYLDEPGTTIEDFPDFQPDDMDVLDALTDLVALLQDQPGIETSSEYIQQIAE